MTANPLQPAPGASDVFSISDAVLSDRLVFVNEIGSGNWGSVWLCRPKPEAGQDSSAAERLRIRETKLAVKLVHRAKANPATEEEKKSAETASKRVKTLWSEMKIVRTLNEQPHPSIIHFQSFIITPSYAMIAMPFLPQLIPVEVPELRAKEWLHSLLAGVAFIHRRGVVHNDIKPANIMISPQSVPVLIDFGFAEHYGATDKDAFISNLHYGTPEYISPERAEGRSHDTRKADVWALGISFFEILVGRTPFEEGEHETFLTTEDLKRYWMRTVSGQWVGRWNISYGAERMLRGMLEPRPDARYSAADAMTDRYWTATEDENAAVLAIVPTIVTPLPATRRRSTRSSNPPSTRSPSVIELLSPWATRSSRRTSAKENAPPVSFKRLSAAVSSPRLDAEKKRRSVLEPVVKLAQSHGRMPSEDHPVGPNPEVAKPELRKKPTALVARATEAEAKAERKAVAALGACNAKDATEERAKSPSCVEKTIKNGDSARATSSTPAKVDASRRKSPKLHNASPCAVHPASMSAKGTASRRKAERTSPSAPKAAERRVFITAATKENAVPAKAKSAPTKENAVSSSATRKPLGPRSPGNSLRGSPAVLADRTAASRRAANVATPADPSVGSDDGEHDLPRGTLSHKVVERMHDWEAERARMRAMLGESDDESELDAKQVEDEREPQHAKPTVVPHAAARIRDWEKERARMRQLIAPTDDESTGVIGIAEVKRVDAVAAVQAKPVRIEPQAVSRMRDWEQERARMKAMLGSSDDEPDAKPEPPVKQAVSRIRDWEQERARMRAMLDDSDVEQVEEKAKEAKTVTPAKQASTAADTVRTASTLAQDEKDFTQPSRASLGPMSVKPSRQMSLASSSSSPILATLSSRHAVERMRSRYDESTATTVVEGGETTSANGSALSILKQSLKLPMSFGSLSRRSTCASAMLLNENGKRCLSPVESWTEVGLREEDEDDGVSPQDKEERMLAWARSVEKVVQDARLSFASSMPLLQLPAPPPPASRRPSISQARAVPRRPSRRMQRRIPSATQIFGQDGGPASSTRTGEVKQERSANQLPFPSDAAVSGTPAVTQTPTRPRRNTIGTRSPKPSGVTQSPSSELNSPSKRKERWRSQGNLLDRKIVPSEILSVELDRSPPRKRPQRLSALVDRSAFLADLPVGDGPRTPPPRTSRGSNDLLATPFHVESCQMAMCTSPAPDSPSRRQAETAYDQIVMSSSGVKRVGQGYQSAPPPVTTRPEPPASGKRSSRFFPATRRPPMPPPVSSDDVRRAASIDEFGRVSRGTAFSPPTSPIPDGAPTVWRALKAAVTGKTSRRVSGMQP